MHLLTLGGMCQNDVYTPGFREESTKGHRESNDESAQTKLQRKWVRMVCALRIENSIQKSTNNVSKSRGGNGGVLSSFNNTAILSDLT